MKTPKCAAGTDWERVKREAAADAPIDNHTGPVFERTIYALPHCY